MKYNTILAAAVSAAMLMACGPKYVKPAASAPSPEEPSSNVEFALNFFQKANHTISPDENLLLSPYSAGVALSMLEEGAEGETKAEFDNALANHLYRAENLGSNDTVIVESASSVWISDNFSVRNRYVSLLENYYDAFITTQNFSDPATVKAINNWCGENTAGKINHILNELTPNDVMVLINALYFNAPWAEEFDPKQTSSSTFKGMKEDREVQMMQKKDSFEYAEYQGCQMVRLPYAGGRYSMLVVLPPHNWDINTIIPYINESMYDAAMDIISTREVILQMPKFKLETELILNKTLNKMGIWTAFDGAADFKGISAMGPLSLGMVKQKCYIDVTEKGTEAAAVTVAQVRLTSARPMPVTRMTVDRPFLFLIADAQTDNILFAGKVVNL